MARGRGREGEERERERERDLKHFKVIERLALDKFFNFNMFCYVLRCVCVCVSVFQLQHVLLCSEMCVCVCVSVFQLQ